MICGRWGWNGFRGAHLWAVTTHFEKLAKVIKLAVNIATCTKCRLTARGLEEGCVLRDIKAARQGGSEGSTVVTHIL